MSTVTAFTDLYDALMARFATFWTASGTMLLGANAANLVHWPDRGFDEAGVDRNVGYLALHILDGAGRAASLSRVATLHRWPGVFDVQVFRGRETGQRKTRVLADAIAGAFSMQTISTPAGGWLRMRETSVADIGEDGDWTRHNVWTPFEYEAAYSIT